MTSGGLLACYVAASIERAEADTRLIVDVAHGKEVTALRRRLAHAFRNGISSWSRSAATCRYPPCTRERLRRSLPRREMPEQAISKSASRLRPACGVRHDLSDSLRRLATGSGLRKRSHYENADETVVEAMRPVIIKGIDDLATRPDLAESRFG